MAFLNENISFSNRTTDPTHYFFPQPFLLTFYSDAKLGTAETEGASASSLGILGVETEMDTGITQPPVHACISSGSGTSESWLLDYQAAL